jgi:UDP-N-acetylmuramyl tripeptide synthase
MQPPTLSEELDGTGPPPRARANLNPRLAIAIAAGKAAGTLARRLGKGDGTSLPGLIARRIEPNVLSTLVGEARVPTIVIAGSNGKTTTGRLVTALLRAEGIVTRSNAAGANLVQGVTSLAVNSADLHGRLKEGMLVAEVDEGALAQVVPELAPRAVLVLDLFRDQLDRYGELHAVSDAIERVARSLPPETAWVVNADDPVVASLASERTGRRVTFGLDLDHSTDRITTAADSIRCPRCRSDLVYEQVYLSHLGAYGCPGCGLRRPPLDIAVTALRVSGSATSMTVRSGTSEIVIQVPQAGVHIAYDVAAAIAVVVGLDIPVHHAAEALAAVSPAFGRLETAQVGDRRVVLGFVKNPTSYNTSLQALSFGDEPRQLLVAASNTEVDGEDFAWLWDVDFESAAARIERVTVTGTRAWDLATRLKYAGVNPTSITIVGSASRALDAAFASIAPGGRLTILASYTPTLEFRSLMNRRGWVGPLRDA